MPSIKWKFIVIMSCVVIVFVCIYVTLKRLNPALITRLKPGYRNKTKRFIYSNTQIMKTIEEIRYKTCQLSSSSYIRQTCKEERNVSFYDRSKYAWDRRFPGCIIIGTYKSGTRELIDFLYMNSWIVIRRKPYYELDYFGKANRKDLEWYRNEMPLSVPGQLTIEKSPSYFYNKYAPKMIHAMNSSVKLILLVRDPLDRALSQFSFEDGERKYGSSLYNCAMDIMKKNINDGCRYLRHSIYDLPMSRYLKYFKRSQIFIIDALEFRNDPVKVLQKTETFLSIPHMIREENFVYNKDRNIYCLRSDRSKGVCYNENRGRSVSTESLTPEFIQQLKTWFKPHNDEFFRLIKHNFSWS